MGDRAWFIVRCKVHTNERIDSVAEKLRDNNAHDVVCHYNNNIITGFIKSSADFDLKFKLLAAIGPEDVAVMLGEQCSELGDFASWDDDYSAMAMNP